jgi:ribulose-5-phosphate 4-epimerase/fuculose-1-phosphate aldolase
MIDDTGLREEIVRLARRMVAAGLVSGTSGNISGRSPGADRIVITPSGVDYDDMAASDLVVVDLDGRVIDGDLVPSVDTMNHVAVHRARADVSGVVHTHSLHATAFAIVGRPIPALHIEAAGFLGGPVRVMDYLPPARPDLAGLLADALSDDRAILLPNHGVVAVGESLEQAYRAASTVEETARMAWIAESLGDPRPVDDGEVARMHTFIHQRYGQRPS